MIIVVHITKKSCCVFRIFMLRLRYFMNGTTYIRIITIIAIITVVTAIPRSCYMMRNYLMCKPRHVLEINKRVNFKGKGRI